MRWPLLTGISIYTAFLAVTWAGIFVEIPWIDSQIAALEVMIFHPNIVYPSLFLITIGFGLGFYVPRIVDFFFTKKIEYNTFRERYRATRSSKTIFWNILARFYQIWGGPLADMQDSLEEFIDDLEFPEWILTKKGDLLPESQERLCNNLPSLGWQFAIELYKEVDDTLKGRPSRNLLSYGDCEKFHIARQDLEYFWDEIGEKVFKSGVLRYEHIEPELQKDLRLLKILPYLSVALHLKHRQFGAGTEPMYRLSARLFGATKPSAWQRFKETFRGGIFSALRKRSDKGA